MKKRETRSQIRCTAAEVLAAAVLDYDPKTFVLKGGETPSGFFFDFIFVSPISKDVLPLIEERMRQIAADNLEIKVHEMIPKNGAQFLRHHRSFYPAHFAEICRDSLVQVIHIGPFVDHVSGNFLKRTKDLKAFRLLSLERRPDLIFKRDKKQVYRIRGVADESKEALKAFMKKHKGWIGTSHLEVGKALGLFEFELGRDKDYVETGKIYWKKEGESLLHQIYSYWRKERVKEGFEIVAVGGAHQKLYTLSKRSCIEAPVRFAEFQFPCLGEETSSVDELFGENSCHQDCCYTFCLKKDLVACLHASFESLDKIPKKLGLKYSIKISCPNEFQEFFKEIPIQTKMDQEKEARIEWEFVDNFEQNRKGPFLTVQKEGKVFIIKQATLPCVEQLIALVLEVHEKDLSRKKELLSRIVPSDE